jgi:hypothetical protein
MTTLIIKVDRDAHDDDEFLVEEEEREISDICCDNCGQELKGATILGHFHNKDELMIYLAAKIDSLVGD